MSSRSLLWLGLIGVAVTMLLLQSIASAKSLVKIDRTSTSKNIIAIADAKKPTASDRFASGLQKYRKGDVQGALADFNRAIEIDPKYAIAYYGRGFLAAEKLQDIQGALADFNRAIELDPNNAVAYCARGVLKHEYLSDKSGDVIDLQTAAKLYQEQGRTQEYQHAIDLLKKWRQNGES
ncbi:tetratricopeptide repeat protein [Chamaesiphon sp. VAR_69_metabat_338]|uniref:tetratricopeptide repeat protein n=1 Tax=Chamaesiphon sp. VAR_69_metabat_338 TaxID=2964704 RepID=UPI00286DC540|nr:tetratricopeptide repeat protein [Chamaesiphon sp. VAR_69_metabat_338]